MRKGGISALTFTDISLIVACIVVMVLHMSLHNYLKCRDHCDQVYLKVRSIVSAKIRGINRIRTRVVKSDRLLLTSENLSRFCVLINITAKM